MGWYTELIGDALDAFNKALNVSFEAAQLELGMTPDKLVIRDVNPYDDLGHTRAATLANGNNWHVLSASGGTVTSWVNLAINNTRFITIHGFGCGSPASAAISSPGVRDPAALETIEVTRGGKLLRVWHVGHLTKQHEQSGFRVWYADDPFTVPQNITIKIEPVLSFGGTFDLVLIGRAVEANSLRINK